MNIIISYKQDIYYGNINNIIKTSGTLRNSRVNSKQMHHQQQTQIMPGNTSYADMVKKGKNFTILGDSITVGIKQIERNKHSKGNIHLKTFREATCTDMLSYVQPTLDTTKSDGIIIHVGTNDVSANRKRLSDIANSIISVGKKC